jgi:PAS domain S-box-containing protein
MKPPHIEAEAYLAAIIDSSEDAIISKDLNGNITSWNPAAEQIFGYSASEVIGRHISLLIPADRLMEEEYILTEVRQGKRIEHMETLRRAKDGRLLNLSITVSPIRDKNMYRTQPTGCAIFLASAQTRAPIQRT